MPLYNEANGKVVLREQQFIHAGGLRFDGVANYVITPEINLGTVCSYDVFIKFISIKPSQLILNRTTGSYYALGCTNSALFVNYGGIFGFFPFTLLVGQVYHIVVTRNGLLHNLYVDGVMVGSFNLSAGNTFLQIICGDVFFGNAFNTNADINGHSAFNKALTQAEIDVLYRTKGNVIPASCYPNLIANYRFWDAEGFTLKDTTGNGNDGILTNYTLADVTIGAGNKWLGTDGNPYL